METNIPAEKGKLENIYRHSEIIVKSLVDKLINLSVRRSYADKINNELGNFCFDFMKNQINCVFESYYIAHTKHPANIQKNINKANDTQEITWKIKKPKINTWVEIIEPGIFPIDRHEGSKVNFKEIEKKEENKKSSKNNVGINKNNLNKGINFRRNKAIHKTVMINPRRLKKMEIIEQNEIDKSIILSSKDVIKMRDSPKKKETNKKEQDNEKNNKNNNINNNNIINNKNDNNNNNNNNINNNNNNNKNNNNNNNNNNISTNRNKRITMIEFPFEDIPNIKEDYNHEKYDVPDIENLRKKFEESLIKKEQERKRQKLEQEKEKKQKININDKKDNKLFDSKKLTFDSNGQIISFKPYKTDKLRDFFIPKNIIKDIKKNDVPKIIKKNKKTDSIIEIEENVIKNIIPNNDIDNKKINSKSEKIIPSGSNFKIISPDIGVVIKENDQLKEGPKDFSKFFNKYSLDDYNKMLSDYLPNLNRNLFKAKIEESLMKSSQRSILNMNNKTNIKLERKSRNSSELNNVINNEEVPTYNPLISSPNKGNNLPENDLNYKTINTTHNVLSSKRTKLNASNNNNPLLSSYNNIFTNVNNNLYSTNYDKTISVKKGMGSLKLELDSLRDLTETIPTFYKDSDTTSFNIIGNKFRIKNKSIGHKNLIYSKNTFSDFNKKILANQKWGEFNENNSNTINTVYSKHQTKTQILRELGSNILSGIKIKLPRNRKVDLTIK